MLLQSPDAGGTYKRPAAARPKPRNNLCVRLCSIITAYFVISINRLTTAWRHINESLILAPHKSKNKAFSKDSVHKIQFQHEQPSPLHHAPQNTQVPYMFGKPPERIAAQG